MEASAQVDCDLENEEAEDLEFFQKSIKVHDRFGGNYDEEDEFFSDDEPDEPLVCQKEGCLKPVCQKEGCLKPVSGFSRSIRSSEAKMETISMFDDVRSSCSKSSPSLSLEMLNLKSGEASLGNFEGVLLGKSLLTSDPPFGDPLSEIAILDSALDLLDDKTCQKFREKGLFDGLLVDENAISVECETKAEEKDVVCVEAKLDMATSCDQQTPEPYSSICDSIESIDKPLREPIHDDISKLDVQPSVKSGPLLSCQLKKPRQSKSANSSRKQLNDSSSLDCKSSSFGREFPPSNLSLDELVRYINGESLTKVCSKKVNASPGTLPCMKANTKKSKKQPVRKSDVSAMSKARIPLPATTRLPKTTKTPSHVVRTKDITEVSSSGPQAVCCDAVVKAISSTATTAASASAKEAISAGDAEREDENAGQEEEFVAVLHKKRMKTRKEPFPNPDAYSDCVVPPRTKGGGYQPEKSSGQVEKDPGAFAVSVFSTGSRSYRSDTSGGSIASKRDSLSSLDESPPATCETSSVRTSGNQGQAEVPYACPSFSKFSSGNSYASVLLQNLPKLSVTGSQEVVQTEPKGETNVAIGTFASPPGSEAENETFLSPPQSEADTGFSSSSSLSPDEAHISLASDSAVIMSEGNQVADSDPRSRSLDESFSLICTTDVGDVNVDEPVAERIVRDSVSHHVSNLDFPLDRILELSGRNDWVLQNTGETSLACSGHYSSCMTTQSKKPPVLFDTRIRPLAHTKSNSDIVFVFDPDDSGIDAMSNVSSCVPVDDIDGITFTSSLDSMPFETGASKTIGHHHAAVDFEASLDTKTSVHTSCVEPFEDLELVEQPVSDHANCEVDIPQPDSEFENPVSGGRSVMSGGVSEAGHASPHGSFDLLAAQKFLSRAFKNVLKLERECPSQVVRL